MNWNLSCYVSPYKNFDGPLSNAKDINIDRHPKLNKLLNLLGIRTINGRNVKEISIKIITFKGREPQSKACYNTVSLLF